MPAFSVITITYNAGKYLERTIKSIISQTSDDYEYIIIDGGSKDNTLEIAEKYKSHIDVIISEKDEGLYDAMNKGLSVATGKYVWFMNAGDEIARPDTIKKILSDIQPDTGIIYGDTFFVNDEGKVKGLRSFITPHKLPQHLHWRDMRLGMVVCHQSFIAAREIAPAFILNNLSADIDWEIKCLKRSDNTYFYDGVIARYLEGGISNKNLRRSLIDRFIVLKNHFGWISTIIAHCQIVFRGIRLMISNKGKYW